MQLYFAQSPEAAELLGQARKDGGIEFLFILGARITNIFENAIYVNLERRPRHPDRTFFDQRRMHPRTIDLVIPVLAKAESDKDLALCLELSGRTTRLAELVDQKNGFVEGVIFNQSNNHFIVDLNGELAFLSEKEMDPPDFPVDGFEAPDLQSFQLISFGPYGHIEVSRRGWTRQRERIEQAERFNAFHNDQIVTGKVIDITPHSVTVEVDRFRAFVALEDVAWRRLQHPWQLLKIGQEVSGKIRAINSNNHTLSISLKALQPDPWYEIAWSRVVGSTVDGVIREHRQRTVIVDLFSGVEGYIPQDEISWISRGQLARDSLQTGAEISAKVIDIDDRAHSLVLSIKRLTESPWNLFASQHSVGSIVEATLRDDPEHGRILVLPGGVFGHLIQSEPSGSFDRAETNQRPRVGDTLKVEIAKIDAEGHNIALRHMVDQLPSRTVIAQERSAGSVVPLDFRLSDPNRPYVPVVQNLSGGDTLSALIREISSTDSDITTLLGSFYIEEADLKSLAKLIQVNQDSTPHSASALAVWGLHKFHERHGGEQLLDGAGEFLAEIVHVSEEVKYVVLAEIGGICEVDQKLDTATSYYLAAALEAISQNNFGAAKIIHSKIQGMGKTFSEHHA